MFHQFWWLSMVKLNLSLQSCFLFSSSASFSASCCARLPGNGASGPTPSAAATAGAESTFTGGSAGAFRETQRRRGSFCQARSTMRMSRSLGVGWRWWLLGKNRWILLVNLGISSKKFEGFWMLTRLQMNSSSWPDVWTTIHAQWSIVQKILVYAWPVVSSQVELQGCTSTY